MTCCESCQRSSRRADKTENPFYLHRGHVREETVRYWKRSFWYLSLFLFLSYWVRWKNHARANAWYLAPWLWLHWMWQRRLKWASPQKAHNHRADAQGKRRLVKGKKASSSFSFQIPWQNIYPHCHGSSLESRLNVNCIFMLFYWKGWEGTRILFQKVLLGYIYCLLGISTEIHSLFSLLLVPWQPRCNIFPSSSSLSSISQIYSICHHHIIHSKHSTFSAM